MALSEFFACVDVFFLNFSFSSVLWNILNLLDWKWWGESASEEYMLRSRGYILISGAQSGIDLPGFCRGSCLCRSSWVLVLRELTLSCGTRQVASGS